MRLFDRLRNAMKSFIEDSSSEPETSIPTILPQVVPTEEEARAILGELLTASAGIPDGLRGRVEVHKEGKTDHVYID